MHDERHVLAQDLLAKRERVNEAAHKQREMRDRLNDVTREHSHRRDELNAQVRGLVETANAHRARRDELNLKVREGKAQRDVLNRIAHDKMEALAALRRERGDPQGAPLHKLKAEVKRLEYEHQTKVLTPAKEKALIETITTLQKQIRDREGADRESGELRAAQEAARQAREAAEAQHHAVTELAREAQAQHDAMVQLFGQADALRKQADAAQADFVKNKIEADKTHRGYIEAVQQIRDLERVAYALRETHEKQDQATHLPAAGVQAAADEIFDRFRKGEKLSTEDLMALQKAGRL